MRVPMPGDAVRATNSNRILVSDGTIGIINGTVGEAPHSCQITFLLSTAFRGLTRKGASGPERVSVSGGPVWEVPAAALVRTREMKEILFWRWKNYPTKGGGVEYALKVPVWELDVGVYLENR